MQKREKQPYFCVIFSFYCKKAGAEDAFSVKIREKKEGFFKIFFVFLRFPAYGEYSLNYAQNNTFAK